MLPDPGGPLNALRHLPAAAALAWFFGAASIASAQSLWMPRDRPHAILLEALHPSIEYTDPDFGTGAAFLGGRWKFGSQAALVVEAPYARFGGTYYDGNLYYYGFVYGMESATVGNPYLGVEFQDEGSIFFAELGVRAPLVDDGELSAIRTGTLADRGRFDAFVPNEVPIHFAVNLREVAPSGLMLRLRLGAVMNASVGNQSDDVSDFFAAFAWQIGYEGTNVRVGTAISGTTQLNDYGNIGARTRTSFEMHADFGAWTARPGVELKVPIGSVATAVPLVLGLSVGVSF